MDVLSSDSDWDSFSDSSEDQEEMDFLYGGKAQSLLSNLEETIDKIDDLLSFERGFLHGDIVCSTVDQSGPMGRVINVNMLVDLETASGKVIRDVDSKNILKIRAISVGDIVVLGHWVGRVDKVVDSVTVRFDDGTRSDVLVTGEEQLVPISPNLVDDTQYVYYPGQRVKVKVSGISRSTRWLCGNWRESKDVGTVCAVKAGLVHVEWLASVLTGCATEILAPLQLQEAKNLTLLSCFTNASWQLGDWCVLSVADCQDVINKNNLNLKLMRSRDLNCGLHQRKDDVILEEVFVIAKTKTKVDVAWQDGSCSFGVDSQSLLPINIIDAHDFWPEQFVLEKSSDDPLVPLTQKWGVVQSMETKEKTVRITWKSASSEQANDLNQSEEIVSAYELIEHPDYNFCLGDIVFKLIQNPHVHAYVHEGNKLATENHEDPKFYLSCVGNVVGFKEGAVEVKWATGLSTRVAPFEIIQCDKYEGSTTPTMSLAGNAEQMNQHVVNDDNSFLTEKGKDSPSSCKINGGSSFSLPSSAIGFLTGFATRLLASFGSTSLLASRPSNFMPECSNGSQLAYEKIEETSDPLERLDHEYTTSEKADKNLEVEEIKQSIDCLHFSKSEGLEHFKQFDIVNDCSDHYFLNDASNGAGSPQIKRRWLKKVQEEWHILEKDLPETIYVRAFEDRLDLLRAAIIGAAGTPYHDGLFFFDILLPPDYPNVPPMVHYFSGGLRVNPNLYESGKVCLSLLNTWTGTGSEVWNPNSSTILQVLVSLQSLVLNDQPYFNEAGYDQHKGKTEGERNSISYNENAFLVTCKSMLYLIRRPPKHFEELVEQHVQNRCQNILLACKEYMKGVPVGFAFSSGDKEEEKKGSSTGFKIMLSKLFKKLVEAFSDKGIDCSQFQGL